MVKEKKINRGSEWRKWDLHLHSFYTSIHNEFKVSSLDDYLKKIEDSGIKVLGLTNYFNFDKNDWELKDKLTDKGIIVFFNLELRLTYTNKEDDCCDLHLIFSNEISKTDIDTFLTKLNCLVNGTQKTLKTLNNDDKSIAVVEFSKIDEVLKDPAMDKVKNKILIGMLSRGKGNSRSSTMYESLTQSANFVVHSSDRVKNIEDDIKYWSGKDTEKPLICKALFQSSDAHEISQIGKKYTWIKGEPCFETLRQAIVDYENRVLIQDRNPTDSKNSSPSLFIDKIEYALKKDKGKEVLYLNKDINSVIGKRGSGKSVLLKHIVWGVKIPRAKEIKKLSDFKIYWGDDTNEQKFVEYIPQNYLSAITYEDGVEYDERDQKLRELLFNNDLFKNADSIKTETINSIELKIVAGIKDIIKLNKQIVNTQNQLKPLGKIVDKDKTIKVKQQEIDKLGKVDITDEDIKNQTEYVSKIENLNKEISLAEQDIKTITKINHSASPSFIIIDDAIFCGLSQSTLKLIKDHITNLSDTDVKDFLHKTLDELNKNTKERQEDKRAIDELLKPIKENLQKNKTIEQILNEINKLNKEKEEISKLESFIKSTNGDKDKLINEITDFYLSYKNEIDTTVQTLKNEFKDFTFITFDFQVNYKIDLYKKEFFDIFIDGRSGNKFNFYIENKIDFEKNKLKEIIEDILKEEIKLKGSSDVEGALIALLGCRYDIDFTKSVKYKDGDNFIDFENMTGGQKAMALLDLIFNLSRGNFPIIIDQPENDIDVSGISNDLKKLILQQKEKRQVIIATHSPNLLLLTDSENVIVAKNENNNIEYYNGGIEDKYIQEDIVNILEGGEDALRKRMNKLNLKN